MYIYIRYIMIQSDRYVITVYLCPVYIFFPNFKGVCTRVSQVWHNRYCHAQSIFCVEGFLICYWIPIAASFLPSWQIKMFPYIARCLLTGNIASLQNHWPVHNYSNHCLFPCCVWGYRLSTSSALCLPVREGSSWCMCGLHYGVKICPGHGEVVVWERIMSAFKENLSGSSFMLYCL